MIDVLVEMFSMEGRANRSWYFWHIVLDDVVILTMILLIVGLIVATGNLLLLVPLLGVFFAGTWAGIAITIKRLHDLDRPAWHWFLLAVPLYNLYLGLVLLFARGTVGPNRFGADPLGVRYASQHLDELPPAWEAEPPTLR